MPAGSLSSLLQPSPVAVAVGMVELVVVVMVASLSVVGGSVASHLDQLRWGLDQP